MKIQFQLVLHFFEFSTIFYEFCKTGNTFTWNNSHLFTNQPLHLTHSPLEKLQSKQLGPCSWPAVGGGSGRPNSGQVVRRRWGARGGQAGGDLGLPIGGPGRAWDGRRWAADVRQSRRREGAAAVALRRRGKGEAGLGRCGGGRGRCGRYQFEEGKGRGGNPAVHRSSTAQRKGRRRWGTRELVRAAFYRQWEEGKREHGELGGDLGLLTGVSHKRSAATEAPARRRCRARAPWRAGKAPAAGARAVEGWGSNAWLGRHRRWRGAAGKSGRRRSSRGAESRGGARGGRKKKKEPRTDL
jgi:hypothetical protein